MLNGIIGKKVGMSRFFVKDGKSLPVTFVEAGPCVVIQVKTLKRDKYNAVQLGYGLVKDTKVTKPLLGHFSAAGAGSFLFLKEFRVESVDEYKVGQVVNLELFSRGDKLQITGKSKGRGFTGVVKRYNFSGGNNTHGCTTHDKPGSIGASATPSRVFKGKKMPGRHGGGTLTVRNLEIVDIYSERNIIAIKGSVPGANGAIVYLRKF